MIYSSSPHFQHKSMQYQLTSPVTHVCLALRLCSNVCMQGKIGRYQMLQILEKLTLWFTYNLPIHLINQCRFICSTYDLTLVTIHQSLQRLEANVKVFCTHEHTPIHTHTHTEFWTGIVSPNLLFR